MCHAALSTLRVVSGFAGSGVLCRFFRNPSCSDLLHRLAQRSLGVLSGLGAQQEAHCQPSPTLQEGKLQSGHSDRKDPSGLSDSGCGCFSPTQVTSLTPASCWVTLAGALGLKQHLADSQRGRSQS